MSHRLVLLPTAEADIQQIADWISDHADLPTALRYIERLRAFIGKLQDFPRRGAVRSIMSIDVRTVTFERRIVIAYHVDGGDVIVIRVFSGKRDLSDLTL
ncbi:type II toxin-antitoxin system RelE/ParE family toxin [Sphingomonas floccifaciens]|uniref:Type II toxin-antitoxin system RelE/ParE family toxin n=1 Tax=Sphingomonas floccifaciens TaxID=1844115 RepID=A0ABW4N9J8_9SPHN